MGQIWVTQALFDEVSRHFGKMRGQAGYVSWMDINQDGMIDMKDLYFFGQHIGKLVHVPQEPPPPEPPITPPSACMIVFLFGSTILAKVFPILRAFRDVVLPNIITDLYYHGGYVILHSLGLI